MSKLVVDRRDDTVITLLSYGLHPVWTSHWCLLYKVTTALVTLEIAVRNLLIIPGDLARILPDFDDQVAAVNSKDVALGIGFRLWMDMKHG